MTKLNFGVDVSEKTLDLAYWDQSKQKPIFQDKFPNTKQGFQTIASRIEKISKDIVSKDIGNGDVSVLVVMEPSGGYEQPFAHFAYDRQWEVSLPNPYRVKLWGMATGVRAKTDKNDAKTLAHYARMQDPLQWRPLPVEVEQLEHLLRRLETSESMLRQEKNRWHSAGSRVNPHKQATRLHKQTIAFMEQQILKIQKAIKEHLNAHPHLKEQKKLLLTVSGVGERNCLYILVMMHRWGSLTEGKGDIKGLVAYVGLDPKPHESGSSVRKRASISRQGNGQFRARLYMSALGGVKGNNPLRAFYKRLVGRDKPKKVALTAAARKILIWSWVVFSTNTPFDVTRFEGNH
jgi:transposase